MPKDKKTEDEEGGYESKAGPIPASWFDTELPDLKSDPFERYDEDFLKLFEEGEDDEATEEKPAETRQSPQERPVRISIIAWLAAGAPWK